MITYVVGDLFTSPAKVLVNTVNTVGVMGKGIAKDFKRIYPEMFQEYQRYCENGLFDIGKLWLYKTSHKWILNFPTKKHWRNRSKTEYIIAGLEKFVDSYDSKGIVSVSFPMLGCGNGELDWELQVQPLMDKYLHPLPIDIYIHLYTPHSGFVPEHRKIRDMKNWLRSEPQYLPFSEFWRDVTCLANTSTVYKSLDEETNFQVYSDPLDLGLRFEWDSGSFEAGKDKFQELWTQIRPSGYYRVTDLDFDTPINDLLVASLLQHLSYIRPIQLSHHPLDSEWDQGVLLTAPSSTRRSETQYLQTA